MWKKKEKKKKQATASLLQFFIPPFFSPLYFLHFFVLLYWSFFCSIKEKREKRLQNDLEKDLSNPTPWKQESGDCRIKCPGFPEPEINSRYPCSGTNFSLPQPLAWKNSGSPVLVTFASGPGTGAVKKCRLPGGMYYFFLKKSTTTKMAVAADFSGTAKKRSNTSKWAVSQQAILLVRLTTNTQLVNG